MRSSVRLISVGLAAVVLMAASLASAGTLDDVRKRGHLICGINTGLVGFAAPDDKGVWRGFDVDVCRAVAAAVFGDAGKLKYKNLTGKTRFTALRSGEIDILSRNTTWTFSRDVDLQLTFVGVNYYDGQGFMAPKKLGVKSAKDLGGASVCIQTGTTTELNLADFFRANDMKYEPVPIETNTEARTNYLAGRCDVYTTDRSGLAATRAATDNPDAHVVLPEIISKEPLGPAGTPRRRPVGGHRALEPERHDRGRGDGRELQEREAVGVEGKQEQGDQPPAWGRGTAGP